MPFLRAVLFLLALTLPSNASEECQEVPTAIEDLVRERDNGWSVIRLILFFDWTKKLSTDSSVKYPLIIEMDPSKASRDANGWIKSIKTCLAWVEYSVATVRMREETGGAGRVWLETPLLLPSDEVARQVQASAWVLGEFYQGVWQADDLLVLVPQESLQ